ncbi:MAG TPA: AAA family ATPase, partial [Bryobacteraceae bacterium]|nr:AAA family ATPase [Bryobacteraceae bacterium]
MLISEFQIQNFKSYRETERVALTSGINIVTGQNNAGKTALLEAVSMSNPNHMPHRSMRSVPAVTGQVDPDSIVSLTATLSTSEFLYALRGKRIQIPLPLIGEPFGDNLTLKNYNAPELEKFRNWFFSRETYAVDLAFKRSSDTRFVAQPSLFSLSNLYRIASNAGCVDCTVTENGPGVLGPQIGG